MGKTKTAFVSGMGEEPQIKEKDKAQKKSGKVHISGLKGGQRIKTVEAGPIIEKEENVEEKTKKAKKIKVRGKKYQEVKSKIDREKLYSFKDAIKLTKETSFSKFDGTMELHLVVKKLGLSVKITLPFSSGKEKKIEIANEETLKKLSLGKTDFDILLATPEMMPKLIPFARILGPKGLMPNPKNGTLINNLEKAKSFSRNTVTLKTEKEAPLIHTIFGKVSQKEDELIKNLEAIIKAIGPKQIIKAFVKATMSPSVKINISQLD